VSAEVDPQYLHQQMPDSWRTMIDANRLRCMPIDLLLIDDAKRGLADIAAGRTVEADSAIGQLQQCRKAQARA
jgi:hypothetical protein